MTKKVKRLEAFFKQKDVNLDKDNGDDNSFGKYWEFINVDNMEYWSIELVSMTNYTHFVPKFKNLPFALQILNEQR
jgi:hypothetical protein